MLIADSQVHIWRANTPQHPWLKDRKPHRDIPIGIDELLNVMNTGGVHRAVIVPPNWEGSGNDFVLEAAQRYPDRFAAMGRLDAEDAGAVELIKSWHSQRGMLGLRCGLTRSKSDSALLGRHADQLWTAAENAATPIMFNMGSHAMLSQIDAVAERHPQLKIALCHLALTNGKQDDEAFRDLDQLLALAKHPNIAVKVSALPCYTEDLYPYRRLHPYIRRVYDAYGPRRMFWGTDFSRLPGSCSYHRAVTMFTEEIAWFTSEDLEWIMGRGLCEWLGWKLPRLA